MQFTTISQAKKETGLAYLGNINSSSKIAKNGKVSNQYTYSLYLAPSSVSGYNTCPMATKECIAGCLHTSGRVKLDKKNIIVNSRIAKTKLFFEHREFFMAWLVAEIETAKAKADRDGYGFSARLNCTSDINWNVYKVKDGKTIFELFPDVQFYDYTKISKKFDNIAPNYHLTMSYTGYNWDTCNNVLSKGFNVAVIFNVKKGEDIPETFNGYKVIDGDLTDYRPDDEKGVVVGLRWKNVKDRQANEYVKNSPFVVQP